MDTKLFESLSSLGYAFIGGLLALLGTLISLRHEHRKAKEEREFNVKQNALSSAIESVTRCITYYTTLPDRNLPIDGETPIEFSEMEVSLNRLQLYCNNSTLKKMSNLGEVGLNSFSKALKLKMQAMFCQADINIINNSITNLQKINDQLHQEIVSILASNSKDQILVSHYQQRAANENKIAELHSKAGELIKKKYEITEKCRDIVIEEKKDLSKAMNEFILSARKELLFPIDENLYNIVLNQSTESGFDIAKTHHKEIREIMTEVLK